MGTLRYGGPEIACEFDDRTLAHLAVVIIDKLRHGEAFWFSFAGQDGPTTLWISLAIPLRFDFADPRPTTINRGWITALERAAQSVHGLRVLAEPPVRPPQDVAAREHELASVKP